MLTNNPKIDSLKYNDPVSRLMENEDTRSVIASMSFGDYHRLIEASADIVPPSGVKVGGRAPVVNQPQQVQQPQQNTAKVVPPAGAQAPGGAVVGMNPQVPTQQGQPANAAKAVGAEAQKLLPPGVKVPMMPAKPGVVPPGQVAVPGQPAPAGQGLPPVVAPTQEEVELRRLRELAGLGEEGSAGGIGSAAVSVGADAVRKLPVRNTTVRKRTEESPSLEHPDAGRKTVPGDMSHGACDKLAANNAVRDIPGATRQGAGIYRPVGRRV
jgi:hypothetical protein